MPEGLAARLTVVSLNTRGVPVIGSHLAGRYAVIGAALEAGDADIACFQEVLTWWHLRLLARRMRSFRYVSWRASPAGPAGGLVTFSRLPVSSTVYRGFGLPPRAPGISGAARLRAALKGVLVTRLARPEMCVINTHPVANRDGDWSRAGRFYPLHRAQLDGLAAVVHGVRRPGRGVRGLQHRPRQLPVQQLRDRRPGWTMRSRAAARPRSGPSTSLRARRRTALISS